MSCITIATPIHVTIEVYVLITIRDMYVFAIKGLWEDLVVCLITVQLNHAKMTGHVLQNRKDIFVIAMQATMGKIVNATWMNVHSIYAQQDRYAMIMLVDLHVFGKITDDDEVY